MQEDTIKSKNPKVVEHKKVCGWICGSYVEENGIDERIYEKYKCLKEAKKTKNIVEIQRSLFMIARDCINSLRSLTESETDICEKMTNLYERKNHDYGDSFTQMRKEYDNAILVRVFDKYSRLKTLLSAKENKVKDESIADTVFDLANYCVMELVEMTLEESGESNVKD